ncbi:MAG: hypothetical protein HYZ71_06110 [Deltaproteobacteria bacterium]|nr:hypothetical protein [Deltaproteobacteria bacterium]
MADFFTATSVESRASFPPTDLLWYLTVVGISSISLIISACVDVSLCTAALMRNFRSRLCQAFGALSLLLFFQDAMGVVESFRPSMGPSSLRSLVTLLISPCTLWFLAELVPRFKSVLKRWWYAYVPVFIGAFVWLSSPQFDRTRLIFSYVSHFLYLIPTTIWLIMLFRATQISTVAREKTRYRHVTWGALIVLLVHMTDLLEISGANVPGVGTLARTFYLVFLFQVFIQRELMTAQEVVAKIALFGGVAVILTSFYSLLVSWVGDRPGLFFFNTLIASFGIIVLFDPIRNATARFTRKLFLERHNTLERELSLLSSDLMGTVDAPDLGRRIGRALTKALGVKSAALFLAQADNLSLAEVAGSREVASTDSLIEYISLRRGRPFVLETIENDRESFHSVRPIRFCEDVLSSMRGLGADFVIPFMHDSRLVGFTAATMGERILLTTEQLRLFFPVSRQIAVILKNAQAFSHATNREKLAAVGEMAAGLAHEIKNPLGAIRGAAELLKDSSQRSDEFINIILDETDRLTHVVTDILDFAKPRRSSPQTACDPLQVIEHTVKLFQKEAKITVVGARGPTLSIDPEGLKQVLVNLLLNAVQAGQGVGRTVNVTVTVNELRPKPATFLDDLPIYKMWEGWQLGITGETRDYLEIEVADDGPGIPEVELPRLFIPFHTTKQKGTGLGLAICRRLIDSMGGTITVQSVEGEGTRFKIHLPLPRERRPVRSQVEDHGRQDISPG